MKAVIIKSLEGKLEMENIEIPIPKNDELLIKNEASQINPADLNQINFSYKEKLKNHPYIIPGFEAIGRIVKVGSENLSPLLGKRVVYGTHTGTWSEYSITNPLLIVVIEETDLKLYDAGDSEKGLPKIIPSFANPLTVIGMLDIIKNSKTECVVQTGASSSCGQMFLKLCQLNGIETINIVRRHEHKLLLKNKFNAKFVLVQTDKDFKINLKKLIDQMKPKICFECVAGDLTGLVLNSLPPHSTMYVYGSLSLKPISGINPAELIYNQKTIKPYQTLPYFTSIAERVPELMEEMKIKYWGYLGTQVSKFYDMRDVSKAVEYYKTNMSEGKVVLIPKF